MKWTLATPTPSLFGSTPSRQTTPVKVSVTCADGLATRARATVIMESSSYPIRLGCRLSYWGFTVRSTHARLGRRRFNEQGGERARVGHHWLVAAGPGAVAKSRIGVCACPKPGQLHWIVHRRLAFDEGSRVDPGPVRGAAGVGVGLERLRGDLAVD